MKRKRTRRIQSETGRGLGAITAEGSLRTSEHKHLRRLERRVLVAKLKIARVSGESVEADMRACLETLRAGLSASDSVTVDGEVIAEAPDFRERRLSAATMADIHLKSAGLADGPDSGDVTVNQDNRTQVLNIPAEWMDDPLKREAVLRLTEGALAPDDAPVAQTNGHTRNGSES